MTFHLAWLHLVFAIVFAAFLNLDNVWALSWDNVFAAVGTFLVSVAVSLTAVTLSVSGLTMGSTVLSLCIVTQLALDTASAHISPPAAASASFRAATTVFGTLAAGSALILPAVARTRRNAHGPGRTELAVPGSVLGLSLFAILGSGLWLGGWVYFTLPSLGWLQLLQGGVDIVVQGMGPFVVVALQALAPLAPQQPAAFAFPAWLLLLGWCIYLPGAAESMAVAIQTPLAPFREKVVFVCQFIAVAALLGATAGLVAVFARLRARSRALQHLPLYHPVSPSPKDSPFAGAMATGVSGVPPEYYAPPPSSAELAFVK